MAKSFLQLVDKHFPRSHKLHKIFNRNNLKVSYSCTTNMANIIKSHNQKILNENNGVSNERKCNCRNKDLCPLDGACLTSNVIYEATVTTTTGDTKTYIGMTEHEFKTRYNNHKLSFRVAGRVKTRFANGRKTFIFHRLFMAETWRKLIEKKKISFIILGRIVVTSSPNARKQEIKKRKLFVNQPRG